VATALGGSAWDKAGKIWYDTLRSLHSASQFVDMVTMSTQAAGTRYGTGSTEEKAVAKAWKDVGF
jgi:Zn-dependent metalloprotease